MNSREKSAANYISETMREARIRNGLTQQQLAQALEVAQGTLSKMETGVLIPSAVQWQDFCHLTKTALEIKMKGEVKRPKGSGTPRAKKAAPRKKSR